VLLKYVGIHPIVVHGGGRELAHWLDRLEQSGTSKDQGGELSGETSVIREMVLSGKVNNEIVSAINRAGGRGVGLSGKDANLFLVKKRREPSELGFTGEIEATDVTLVQNLAAQGYIPVISSIGLSREGESFEVSPDNVSGEIAESLKATKLIYLTEAPGVLRGEELIPFLDLQDATSLLGEPQFGGEMRSIVEKSVSALKGGVTNVHILDCATEHAVLLEIFTDTGVGTMLSNERIRV
jgi:acetylglutamate kinase